MVASRSVRRPDIVVHSSDGAVQLVVEVKSLSDKTDEWAATFRRNLIVHGAIPASRFFLLAMSDYFYLWRGTSADYVPPEYKVAATDVLKLYLRNKYLQDLTIRELGGQGLELLVESWLSSLINSQLSRGSFEREDAWLFDSGMYESIKDGYLEVGPIFA
jgi:hypothetical protein